MRHVVCINFQNKSFFVQDEKFSPSSFSSLEHCLNNCVLTRVWLRNWHSRKQILHGEIYGHLSCELTFHNCRLLWGPTAFPTTCWVSPFKCSTDTSPYLSKSKNEFVFPLKPTYPSDILLASKLQYLSSSLIFAFNITFKSRIHILGILPL